MSSLSMVEGKLPAGFRFHPRDDELICDYLINKLLLISPIPPNYIHSGFHSAFALLVDVDLNKCEPWDLPEIACIGGKEWYFYSQRDRKYATGLRTNRATVSGYWKATGKDRAVVRKGSLVGMRKTLVFYQGRAPKGRKTNWVMHEFRLEGPFAPAPKSSPSQEDWVLCRVFHKSRESFPPKQNPNEYDETASSSLPALMDSYINSDADNENANLPNYQQVPCFSHLPLGAFGNTLISNNNNNDTNAVMSFGDESARDRHVIKEVLSHLTNNVMDDGSEPELKGSSKSRISNNNNIGDEEAGVTPSESYLSDVMWTSHY